MEEVKKAVKFMTGDTYIAGEKEPLKALLKNRQYNLYFQCSYPYREYACSAGNGQPSWLHVNLFLMHEPIRRKTYEDHCWVDHELLEVVLRTYKEEKTRLTNLQLFMMLYIIFYYHSMDLSKVVVIKDSEEGQTANASPQAQTMEDDLVEFFGGGVVYKSDVRAALRKLVKLNILEEVKPESGEDKPEDKAKKKSKNYSVVYSPPLRIYANGESLWAHDVSDAFVVTESYDVNVLAPFLDAVFAKILEGARSGQNDNYGEKRYKNLYRREILYVLFFLLNYMDSTEEIPNVYKKFKSTAYPEYRYGITENTFATGLIRLQEAKIIFRGKCGYRFSNTLSEM